MRLGKRLLFASTFIAIALGGSSALAQKGPPTKPAQSSAQFSLHREDAGGAEANVARTKARAGDCAGALPAFDAAIRVTIEPTLRRDRGLCHEQVGHPFPAIDDYRAYLVARPDAPDADQIRDRLAKLEESVGVGAQSSQQVRDRDKDNAAGFQASASMSADGEGVSASTSGTGRARRGDRSRGYDYYVQQERLADAADSSPLRLGTGWILGPYMNLPRYFTRVPDVDLFMAFGISIRYAWSPSMTFIMELGYAGALDRGASASGVQTFMGIEGRIPLDEYASNQLFLGGGAGYENLGSQGASTLHMALGRARFGYRHVFGPSLGLEVGVDGGGGYLGGDGGGDASGLVGGSLALVIGF